MEIKLKVNIPNLGEVSKKYQERFEKAVSESIQEVNPTEILKEEYDKSDLRVRSGVLIGSFKEEKTENTIRMSSNSDYARIHDQGGMNGRNHSSYQRPRYYFTNTAKRIAALLKQKIKDKLNK